MKRLFLFCVMSSLFLCTGIPAAELGVISEMTLHGDDLDILTSTGARVRIDFMQENLFRIWIGPGGELEGEGSQKAPIILPHEYGDVQLELTEKDAYSLLSTNRAALRIYRQPLRFELYQADNSTVIWRELKPIHLEEDGSYQTLGSHHAERFYGGGQQNGSFEFKGKMMEISYSGGWEEGDRPSPAPFYMTNSGYGVLRNTWSDGSYDFRSDDYLTTLHGENRFDAWYIVGDSVHELLDQYTRLTGRAGLLPRWAFEYGDADCYNDGDNVDKPGTVPEGWSDGPTGTTPDVVESVAARYREHDMPGGWILPNDGYGCGYEALPEVVGKLAEYGFQTGLWTENGVEKIAWEVGQAGTRVQKLDVAWTGQGYQWAMDANMDAASGIIENSNSRPFIWTVMGWAGIQRYAVTWTGDQSGSWDYIRWHVPTLIGSGLSGMVYSTGDVDGIFGGSPETFTRDLQWKCFTPVLMGMSGWSKAERKHPWWFDEPWRSINRKYLKLKMRLMPYVYTVARQAAETGAPIIRNLMWDHPDDPHAWNEDIAYQFFLGRDILVAPVYRSQAASAGWRDDVYLPGGQWIDYWDGTLMEVGPEGLFLDYPVTPDRLPVFVRGGAIIPMYPESLYDGQVPKDVLTLDIYPHDHSAFTLYEDDGHTRALEEGEFSLQDFGVDSPTDGAGDIEVSINATTGTFDGILEERLYLLSVHTRAEPEAVLMDGAPLPGLDSRTALDDQERGWFFDSGDRGGILWIGTSKMSVRTPCDIRIRIDDSARLSASGHYGRKPQGDGGIPADDLFVINRPAEEPGHPLENAFDRDPDTWFRTVRDQSIKSGPHEFVLSLGGRREIDGFSIQPRNDKYWKYGNVREYEIYLSDVNGQWGTPITKGSLELSEEKQTIRFAPRAGRLMRFRVLSTHDMGTDPMVLGAADLANGGAFDASLPVAVNPTTISEFQVLEHRTPDKARLRARLTAVSETNGGTATVMNGITFPSCLKVTGNSRYDFELTGDWASFRVDAGLDDAGPVGRRLRFQVFGDDRLLYDSGAVANSEIVKPRLDIRGINVLSLRTRESEESADQPARAAWANAIITGYEGDQVSPAGPRED